MSQSESDQSSLGNAVEAEFPMLAALGAAPDLQQRTDADLERLAAEMRAFLIRSVTRTGGHLGAALGVIELTIALFAELDLERRDRIVWDVGHQTYPHKILTGRAARFDTLRLAGGLSGYPDPAESPYDTVRTGHGGTSISTALGFALAWNLARAERGRWAVAVIGDGALQEGNAYEALNHAGANRGLPLIVVLNDNGMAIGPSVGAVHAGLERARSEDRPASTRAFFAELGFRYLGPFDGHDLPSLRRGLRAARRLEGPVLVHVVTQKGRGCEEGAADHTCFHAVPATPSSADVEYPDQGGRTFSAAFAAHATQMAERDPRVVVVSAAMIDGAGLVEFQRRFPDRCIDVGMAEQHAVALAAGLALAGRRPICSIYSTFLQRAYDQLFQEVALQRARVLFCIDRGGLVGSDGPTHNGVFDIGFLRCLPNFALLSPRDPGELPAMMDLAERWDGPVAIRFPRGAGTRPERRLPASLLPIGRAERVAAGNDGAILAYGSQVYVALELRRRIRERDGRVLAVIDARSAKPLDASLILSEWRRQPVLFTLEEHVTACGFGSAVAELGIARPGAGADPRKLCVLALPDRFIDQGERSEQLAAAGLGLGALEARVAARLRQVVDLGEWRTRRGTIREARRIAEQEVKNA